MLYVLYTISARGTRDILYSSNNVDDVRIFYDNNIDCFTTCSMYRFGVYVGCTEKPLFVLEDNLRYEKIPFDEKPYFYTLEGFYSMEKSDDFDDDDFDDFDDDDFDDDDFDDDDFDDDDFDDDDFDDYDKDYEPKDLNDYEICD